MLFSPSARGFFDPAVHKSIPTDATEISATEYAALMDAQASGQEIVVSGGRPVAQARPAKTAAEILAAQRAAMVVSRAQARLALLAAGLLDDIEAAVAEGDRATQIAWADATTFRRDSPTLSAIAAAIGMSDDDIDDLFRAAALIVP